MGRNKKGLTCTMNKGVNGLGSTAAAKAYYHHEDWVKIINEACEELHKSKNTASPYNNFCNNFDPCFEYLKNGDYYCNCYESKNKKKTFAKKYGNDDWIEFENVKDAVQNTDCGESTIYKSIRESIYINEWLYKQESICVNCSYNTENIKCRSDASLMSSKQYVFNQHLKKHNVILQTAKEKWNKLSKEEKLRYKLCKDKKDIIIELKKKGVKNIDGPALTEYYKIWEKNGIEGLKEYKKCKEKKIKKINPLIMEFKNLNLINNKHIPDIYMNSDLESRKNLLAGLIDSDGGLEHGYWSISQCEKHRNLISDINKLAQSIGWFTRITERQSKYCYKGETITKPSLRLRMTPYHNYDIPLIYERKIIENNCTRFPIIISSEQ